jgi:hypothetical protein
MIKSLYTPAGSLVAIVVFLLVVIAILHVTGVKVGLGANAHVGRLRGSFAVEGFEEHARGGKNQKHTPDVQITAIRYRSEADKIMKRIKDAHALYTTLGVPDQQKDNAMKNYRKAVTELGKLKDRVVKLEVDAELNKLLAAQDVIDAEATVTIMTNYVTASSTTYKI